MPSYRGDNPGNSASMDGFPSQWAAGPALRSPARAGLTAQRAYCPARPATPRRTGRAIRCALMAVGDVLALALAAALAGDGLVRGACYLAVVAVTLAAAGLYRQRIGQRSGDQAGRLALAVTVPAVVLLPWTSPAQTLRLAGIAAALVIVQRGVAQAGLRAAYRRGRLTWPTLIIGTGPAGQAAAAAVREHPELGLRLRGMLTGAAEGAGTKMASGSEAVQQELPGRLSDAGLLTARLGIEQVLVCAPSAPDREVAAAVRACRRGGARVSILPSPPELGLGVPRGRLDELWGMTFIPLRPDRTGAVHRGAKRAMDLTAAAALLALTAPLIGVLAVAVWLDLRLPPLFRQARRVGRGRQAAITKLRTLRPAGDPDTTWVIPAGQASALGRLLRGSHADELPQLAGVLRGELSLVGPRPERPYFASQLAVAIPGYADRERVSAGLTGWAQIHGLTGDTSIEDRARFDNFYIEYWSVWLDLIILARTVTSALSGALKSARGGMA